MSGLQLVISALCGVYMLFCSFKGELEIVGLIPTCELFQGRRICFDSRSETGTAFSTKDVAIVDNPPYVESLCFVTNRCDFFFGERPRCANFSLKLLLWKQDAYQAWSNRDVGECEIIGKFTRKYIDLGYLSQFVSRSVTGIGNVELRTCTSIFAKSDEEKRPRGNIGAQLQLRRVQHDLIRVTSYRNGITRGTQSPAQELYSNAANNYGQNSSNSHSPLRAGIVPDALWRIGIFFGLGLPFFWFTANRAWANDGRDWGRFYGWLLLGLGFFALLFFLLIGLPILSAWNVLS